MAKLPLEGIRILDMTLIWAGPFGTQQLAYLGPEIIRVENINHLAAGTRGAEELREETPLAREVAARNPGVSYPLRHPWPNYFNRYATFNNHARNQRSMTVDLSRPEGKEIFHRLLKISDGFISNPAMHTIEALGLTYEELAKVNPQIIVVYMPLFGCTGPYKYRIGLANTLEAFVGHTRLRYYQGTNPDTAGTSFQGDANGGCTLAQAFMTALLYRQRTGKGQFVDVSQAEAIVPHLGAAYMDYFANGRTQDTLGNRDTSMAPHGCYPCHPPEDSWCVIAVENDEQWQTLCRVMGRPELADDPRFADAVSRYKNQDALDEIISRWTRGLYPYDVAHLCQRDGIPAAPVCQDEMCLSDTHLHARQVFQLTTHPEAGTHLYPGYPYKLSETPLPPMKHAPLLGQDNEYVYKELLGYSDKEYQRLIDERHIGSEYLRTARMQ